MEYWKGIMDWPLKKEWSCEICGHRALIWGLVHATCRCNICHTLYRMRDEKDKVVDVPICQLKPEYYQPAKEIWRTDGTPIDEIKKECWEEFINVAKL